MKWPPDVPPVTSIAIPYSPPYDVMVALPGEEKNRWVPWPMNSPGVDSIETSAWTGRVIAGRTAATAGMAGALSNAMTSATTGAVPTRRRRA